MYKEVLRSIDDAGIFAIVAILLFVSFFVLLLIYVSRMDKKQVHDMSQIPLDPRPSEEGMASPSTLVLNGKNLEQ